MVRSEFWILYFTIVAILVALVAIYSRLTEIYLKLTERDRREKEKLQRWHDAATRRSEAWKKLSEEDKARFNDFYYDHAVGKISDAEFEAMRKELSEKTNGIPD